MRGLGYMLAGMAALVFGWGAVASFDEAFAGKGGKGNGGGGGGPGEKIELCVTFDDAVGDRILSDGVDADNDGVVDAYCDGKKTKIFAIIGKTLGKMRFDTDDLMRPGDGRTVFLDFRDCLSTLPGDCINPNPPDTRFGDRDAPGDDPLSGYPDAVRFQTGGEYALVDDQWVHQGAPLDFRSLAVGDVAYAALWVSGTILFDPSNPDGIPGSDPVTVTRVTETQWTIEAFADDVAVLSAPYAGAYSMPFKLTLDAQ